MPQSAVTGSGELLEPDILLLSLRSGNLKAGQEVLMHEKDVSKGGGNIIEFRGIRKAFPGVVALDDVSFGIEKGEIHALVGENGAGKSTLVKILTGVVMKDKGAVYIDNRKVSIRRTIDAINLGVRCIYQELPLAPSLSIADNIFLGQELKNTGFINKTAQNEHVRKYFKEYEIDINPAQSVEDLSVSMRQIVAVIKATMTELNILLMDEPTATLGEKETQSLFNFMRRMRDKGLSILYISHRLDEIFEIADRVTVLRDGRYQGTKNIKDITKDELITMMSGKDIHNASLIYDSSRAVSEDVILEAKNVCYKNVLKDVSFSVHRGEIFGICGLVGAGKTELLKCIYKIYQCDEGEIFMDGQEITRLDDSGNRSRQAIGLVPEDRKSEGLFLDLDVITNITMASLKFLLRLVFIRKKTESGIAHDLISNLGVKVGSPRSAVRYLSGGNQQKVVFAKWVSAKKKFLMLDEPTRGVDVFGKVEIYKLINSLSKSGISILISTSEIAEALGICDRIGIMNQGAMVEILNREEFSKERILRTMTANQ